MPSSGIAPIKIRDLNRIDPGHSFTHAGWRVTLSSYAHRDEDPDWQQDFESLLERIETPDVVIRHDHCGLVGMFDVGNTRYVVKRFSFQQTKFRFRLASLLFQTQGKTAFHNAIGLLEAGITTPEPVLLMQRYKGRMVVRSWMIYRYLEGTPATAADVREIVGFVRKMHRAGWLHRDPHPENFIHTESGLATIDIITARRRRSRYLQAYDLVLMSHDMPEAPDIYGWDSIQGFFQLAILGHNLLRIHRWVRKTARRLLGIEPYRTDLRLRQPK